MPKIRTSYTVAKKLEIIEWHKANGANLHKTSTQYSIDRKTLREWLNKEDALRGENYGINKAKRKIGCGRKPLSDELDEELFEFFQNERTNGRAVSNKLLSEKACIIASYLGINSFKASDRYISNWKKRFNISLRQRTNESQKSPEELQEVVGSFFCQLKKLRVEHDYSFYNIANMDQTMCRFDNPSNKTNEIKGENSIRIANTGRTKLGFTVALAARANGYKLPAFCIFREQTGRIPPKVWSKLKIPKNVRLSATNNGWMTADKLQEWVTRIWRPNEDDVRRLLILDCAPIHKSPEARNALSSMDTDLLLIPPGCTMLLQPADVSWNRPFKAKIRDLWNNFIIKREKTKKGNLKGPSRQDVLLWVSEAWESISEDIIKKSFLRCGITAALDGSQNGEMHDNLCRAMTPSSDELVNECFELIFDEDEDLDFNGFSDDE